MGILDKLKRVADPRARTVSNDLLRLNAAKSGLGDTAVGYVLDGRDETVLSTISNTSSAAIEACKTYLQHQSPSWPRRGLLAQQDPFDPDFTIRYTRVLSASLGTLPDGAAGTKHAARDVRVLFSEVFPGSNLDQYGSILKAVNLSKKGLTLDAGIRMCEALGGSVVDFVDVLYNEQSRYDYITGAAYRKAVGGVERLFKDYRDAVITAGKRIGAQGRALLLQDLYDHKFTDQPDYLEFAVSLAGDSSRAVREVACSILCTLPAEKLETLAVESLGRGNVNMRVAMVDLLAGLATDGARTALEAHRQGKEKTARVLAAIDTAFAVAEQPATDDEGSDDETGYRAINGERIEIPPPAPLDTGKAAHFDTKDRAELIEIIDKENERIRRAVAEAKKRGYGYRPSEFKHKAADEVIEMFNKRQAGTEKADRATQFVIWGPASQWARRAVDRMPEDQALKLASLLMNGSRGTLTSYAQGAFVDRIREYLHGPNGDIRVLEALDIENKVTISHGWGARHESRSARKGDILRHFLSDDYGYFRTRLDEIPTGALWPCLATNLHVFDEAFGMRPQNTDTLSRPAAIRMLGRLPEAPARYFGVLLEAATGETKAGRAEARELLHDAPGVSEHIVKLLNDTRQAIRAGAAEWIAARNDTEAIPALKARLKKEKSEIAKAAILTALDSLGEDLSGFIGPKALLAEAEVGLKKARFDKLEWMALDHMPAVHYPGNRRVPGEVIKWWLFLAVKLKQPGGNALFDIYLDRLQPEDAETLSTWVLDSWVNYDTARPAEADGNEYANQRADQHYQYIKKNWPQHYPDYTREKAFEEIKRGFMSEYLNTGAATKGLLALAKHAPPAVAADRVRGYLKNHGKRTSQASSLLDMLAAMGDPVTLQVVISAATRLKQKGVQKFAGALVEKVAESKNWTMDELADRTVPSAGLGEEGMLELPCGAEGKLYTAALDDSLVLVIRNPDGKTIRSLPGGPDDETKASKKQLSASRRELKQVVAMQSARLYEALCAARTWPIADWQRDLHSHPIMRKLTERAVWLGVDADGGVQGSFRPTAEGDFTDANDDDVDVESFHSVRLAYGAEMTESNAQSWGRHLEDYEVSPLFTQFGRQLLTIDEASEADTEITDRKGWMTDTFTFRGAATKLGYERGEAMDAGYFNEYLKGFQSAGVMAVIEFSGNCLPEENVPAAMMTLSFERYASGRRVGGTLKLGDVPTVLLSECWNDYRSIVANGAFDENWEQKMPWM